MSSYNSDPSFPPAHSPFDSVPSQQQNPYYSSNNYAAPVHSMPPQPVGAQQPPHSMHQEPPVPAYGIPEKIPLAKKHQLKLIEQAKTLFLGDLSFFCTENDLYRFISPYGQIEEVRIKRSSKGDSLLFGFVRMASAELAHYVIHQLNGLR
jgi:RNA recognition motif-containing protein